MELKDPVIFRRLQLISAVIFHYQVCWSQIFLLPKSVVNQVEKLCCRFLWSGQFEQKAMALVAWSVICTPRQEGGLALKQLNVWNKVALGAQLWKVVSKKNCLWNLWVQSVYLKGESIWNIVSKYDDP